MRSVSSWNIQNHHRQCELYRLHSWYFLYCSRCIDMQCLWGQLELARRQHRTCQLQVQPGILRTQWRHVHGLPGERRRVVQWMHCTSQLHVQPGILRPERWYLHGMPGELRRVMQWMHGTGQLHLQLGFYRPERRHVHRLHHRKIQKHDRLERVPVMPKECDVVDWQCVSSILLLPERVCACYGPEHLSDL